MFTSGLLVLTSSPKQLPSKICFYLNTAKQHIRKVLYINIRPSNNQHLQEVPSNSLHTSYGHLVPLIYNQAIRQCPSLDVRVLQGHLKGHKTLSVAHKLEVVVTDGVEPRNELKAYLSQQFGIHDGQLPIVEDVQPQNILGNMMQEEQNPLPCKNLDSFDNVVLGGTFDRLHNGHKVLLAEALSRCKKRLTIGITDGEMIKNKILWELIEPVNKRMEHLRAYLMDVDPSLQYVIVPIYDPYGPAIEDPNLQCIVASQETLKGANRVNDKRKEKGLSMLAVHIISLIEDTEREETDEIKISSSSLRKRLLGTYYKGKPATKAHLPSRPYLIGLTGGIASGKSNIARDLNLLGAGVVDCDKLAHKAYEKGSSIYENILEEFGSGIINLDMTINRKALGEKVFSDKIKRKWLESLLWPAVQKLAEEQAQQLFMEGCSVVVLEAALLLEAGWQDKVHEVWVCLIPENEAIQRILNRDGITKEQALQRIKSQTSSIERVSLANIVFSSQWERSFTKKQVQNAWNALLNHIESN